MEPVYTYLGARLAERTGPLQPPEVDAQYDYAFGNLCEAIMHMYADLASLVDPEEDVPWVPLFDIDQCPEFALPWLAQVVGVVLPASVTGEAARDYIRDLSFEQVGKPDTIIKVIQAQLVGNKSVQIYERTGGNAYALEIVTATSDTPDVAAVQAAIAATVPAGIIVTYQSVAGWIYQAMITEGGLYSTLATTFTSYKNLTNNVRG